MKFKPLLLLTAFVVLSTQSFGQVKWRINQFSIGTSPYSGSLTFSSYLDNYHFVSRSIISSGFIPDVESYPKVRHKGGNTETYKHYTFGISMNPVNSTSNLINQRQRLDLGFSYLPPMGRSVYYGIGEATEEPLPVGSEFKDISVRLNERIDQLQFYSRYQLRLTEHENPFKVFIGIDLRFGTELNSKLIQVEKTNAIITGYNSDSSIVYVDSYEVRGEVQIRRSLYLTTLMPLTFERDINRFFTLYGTAAFGWGYRLHAFGVGGIQETYSMNYLEFGLKYNFRRSFKSF